jgi:hypothetical protein
MSVTYEYCIYFLDNLVRNVLRIWKEIHRQGRNRSVFSSIVMTFLVVWRLELPRRIIGNYLHVSESVLTRCQETLSLYGTRMFNTVFTRIRQGSLFWFRWIQSAPSYPTSIRSILVLSPKNSEFPKFLHSGIPTKTLYAVLISHMNGHANNISWRVKIMTRLIISFSLDSCYLLSRGLVPRRTDWR